MSILVVMQRTPRSTFVTSFILLGYLLSSSALPASILVYEGFDYGGTAQALAGISGAATGLTGSYSSGNSEGGNMDYDPTGLTFGDLYTTGGHAALLRSGSDSFFFSSRQMAAGSVTGTIYGSFLFQQESPESNDDVNGLLFGPENTTDSTATVSFLTDTYRNEVQSIRVDPDNNGFFASGYEGAATGMASNSPGTNVTMALFEITNVGAVSGTQTVSMWMLNVAQFTNFKAGGLTLTELNSATMGSGSTNVLGRNSLTLNGDDGYISLGNSDYLTLFSFRSSYRMDEIRLSNSSLDEVTPIPEPGVFGALAIGSLILSLRRRRHRL